MVVFDSSPNPSESASVSECTETAITTTTTCCDDKDRINGHHHQQQQQPLSSLEEGISHISTLSPEMVQPEQCKVLASPYHQESPTAIDQCVTPYEGGLDMCLLNMMMYDMDPAVASQFVKVDEMRTAQQVTVCT